LKRKASELFDISYFLKQLRIIKVRRLAKTIIALFIKPCGDKLRAEKPLMAAKKVMQGYSYFTADYG